MDRLERLRASVDVAAGRGVEVGPLVRPTVTPAMGQIYYADHASTDKLRDKYRPDPNVDESQIVDVDFVLGERSLSAAAGDAAPFDYVIASHVIEHVPDIVGWLRDIATVLVPGGRLSLCVPDRRFTFDVRRRYSDIAEVIEAHLLGLRRPAPRAIFDHFYRYVDAADPVALWQQSVHYDDIPLNAAGALELATAGANTDVYLDTHCWVVSDASFLGLFQTLAELDLLDFFVVSFTPTQLGDHEFFVTLERLPSGLSADERLQRILASIPAAPTPLPESADPSADDGAAVGFITSSREQAAIRVKRKVVTAARDRLSRLRPGHT